MANHKLSSTHLVRRSNMCAEYVGKHDLSLAGLVFPARGFVQSVKRMNEAKEAPEDAFSLTHGTVLIAISVYATDASYHYNRQGLPYMLQPLQSISSMRSSI